MNFYRSRIPLFRLPSYPTLNPRLCRVDCWQFERLAARALTDNDRTKKEGKTKIAQVSARYQGEFLPFLEDEPWSFAYRRHLGDLNDRLAARE